MNKTNQIISTEEFDYSDTKHQQLVQKDHIILDQQLYNENQQKQNQQLSCWQRLKLAFKKIGNMGIDYFQFDRLYNGEGQPKVDINKCFKRYQENFDQEYKDKQLKFAYSFQYVEEERIKEQKRKKNILKQELYRFICCIKGNEIREIDQSYLPEEQYKKLLEKNKQKQSIQTQQQPQALKNDKIDLKTIQMKKNQLQKDENIMNFYYEEEVFSSLDSQLKNKINYQATSINTKVITINHYHHSQFHQINSINNNQINQNGKNKDKIKPQEQQDENLSNLYDLNSEVNKNQIRQKNMIKNNKFTSSQSRIKKDDIISKEYNDEVIFGLNRYTMDDQLNEEDQKYKDNIKKFQSDQNSFEVQKNYYQKGLNYNQAEKTQEQKEKGRKYNKNKQDVRNQQQMQLYDGKSNQEEDINFYSNIYQNITPQTNDRAEDYSVKNIKQKKFKSVSKQNLNQQFIDNTVDFVENLQDQIEQNRVKKMRRNKQFKMNNQQDQVQIQHLQIINQNIISSSHNKEAINDQQNEISNKKRKNKRKYREQEDNSDMFIEDISKNDNKKNSLIVYEEKEMEQNFGKAEKKRRRVHAKKQMLQQNHQEVIQFTF